MARSGKVVAKAVTFEVVVGFRAGAGAAESEALILGLAGVMTDPAHEGLGYGRKVVAAALARLDRPGSNDQAYRLMLFQVREQPSCLSSSLPPPPSAPLPALLLSLPYLSPLLPLSPSCVSLFHLPASSSSNSPSSCLSLPSLACCCSCRHAPRSCSPLLACYMPTPTPQRAHLAHKTAVRRKTGDALPLYQKLGCVKVDPALCVDSTNM